MPGENHGWMSLDRYLAIHGRCLEDAEEDFIDQSDPFHEHLFTVAGKPDLVRLIRRQNFLTLRDTIDEVFEWWKDHQKQLSTSR